MERIGTIVPTAKAVRLRRVAELVEDQAEKSKSPDKARELARSMRLRASELESGLSMSETAEAAE
ncbi:MAG: hypothetical protein ACLPZR_20830 [Solirubrobacteraceae bacterium]